MKNEELAGSNSKPITGIDAIAAEVGKSIPTVMRMIRDFRLPAERSTDGSRWQMDRAAFEAWKKSWGYRPGVSESDLELIALERFYTGAGPGTTVSGDIDQLSRRLFTSASTLLSYMRREGCPIQKIDGNRYQVDLNSWELWRLKNHLPPYAPRGRKAREQWI